MALKDKTLKNFKKGNPESLLKQGRKFSRKEGNPALFILLKRKYEKYLYQCRVLE